ncbi:hypothetical protein PSECIP111854_01156 [Pseudoalteromonas sp. CIP111854]|uniref:Uncharacterized protein n=1 Tax=Pseudoalteromonas holothuriae TaxID=2963714 RepID=A0A9W4VX25_9GAMM|nr:DUF6058 family natural product biosynthesis protein [Pseudoalteromonas sp. CIP111854]CAH9053367.1 hypothetical protein PSECIP111854_01156 [Pseudoalteromonas sp. CIP111854]
MQALDDQESIYRVFSYRYKQTIEGLKAQGYHSADAKLNEKLSDHIKTEWTHFLSGTYGLCTRSGLPEDIAAKELAIAQINELTAQSELDESKIEALTHAVNLLDGASSMFAPHERQRSSRYRLVDEVRRKYKLQCQRHIEG